MHQQNTLYLSKLYIYPKFLTCFITWKIGPGYQDHTMIKSPFVKESVLRNLDTCIPRMSYLIPYGKINSKGIKSKTKKYKTTKIKSQKLTNETILNSNT